MHVFLHGQPQGEIFNINWAHMLVGKMLQEAQGPKIPRLGTLEYSK